jgi:hypothetical protein
LAAALAAPGTGSAASYDVARRLELLPAERWMISTPRGLRLGAAQPVAGLAATAGAATFTDRPRAGLTPSLHLSALQAGAAREFALAGQLRVSGARLAAGAHLEAVQLSIAGVQQQAHARGAMFAVMGGAGVAIGARWEGALRPGSDLPGAQAQWAMRVTLPGCSLALVRTSSRYGGEPNWVLGVRAQLSAVLTLALRGGDGEGSLVASTRFALGRLDVAVPVASRMGAGIACGLAFEAAGAP